MPNFLFGVGIGGAEKDILEDPAVAISETVAGKNVKVKKKMHKYYNKLSGRRIKWYYFSPAWKHSSHITY